MVDNLAAIFAWKMFKSHIELECWRYRDETQKESKHWTQLHRHASL